MMAMVYVGYCFVDTYEWVVFLGICYGAGNGVYIAVDYALAVDCLPSQVCHDSSKCAMTHSYVCHDSFIRVPCLIHTCAMPHSYVCHDSFIRVP